MYINSSLHRSVTDCAQIDDGRIIIDTKLWSTYNPQQTLTLEPVDTPPSGVQSNEDGFPPFSSSEFGFDENHPHAPAVRAVEATGRDEQRYMNGKRRPKDVQAKSMSASWLNLSKC